MKKNCTQHVPGQMQIVVKNIKWLMLDEGMKAEGFAKLLGYNKQTIYGKLKNPGRFTGSDLDFICQYFDVTLAQLAQDQVLVKPGDERM